MNPTTLLFFAACPEDTDSLRLGHEARAIETKIASARFRESFRVQTHWATRPTDLIDAINDHRPGIVHFSGHADKSGIALESPDGTTRDVTPDGLLQLFATVKDECRCVLLNACLTDTLAASLAKYIGATVGMADFISDDTAAIFSATFYRGLASGRSVQDAYEQAIAALVLEATGEDHIPRLHVRPGTDVGALVFATAIPRPRAEATITLVLDAKLDDIDPQKFGQIIGELRKVSGDLRLEIGRRSSGSVRLSIDTTIVGARNLQTQFRAARLGNVAGFTVIALEHEAITPPETSASVPASAEQPDFDALLRFVRTTVDSLKRPPEDAIAMLGLSQAVAAEVRRRWTEETSQPIRFARVISAVKGGKRDWAKHWDPAQGYYWRRLRMYLIDKLGRSEPDVRSLDDSTDKILAHLEDPRPTGPTEFRVQGLVIGYVQSGKTANFSALIAKAADAGYKLVVVLSGIHNELRRQTQLRLNREFGIGSEGSTGVCEPEFGKRWVAITRPDAHGDFREGTFNAAVLQGNERVLAVVKKNAMVLRRLIAWMQGHIPPGMPVLVIDDEADQASINTGGNRPEIARQIVEEMVDLAPEDRDEAHPGNEIAPAVINGLIRDLLRTFHRVSFVAYTATPFANVLIGHDAIDRELGQDLYPRDFIISLPRPPQYFGAERLFGRDALPGEDKGVPPLDVIRYIPDAHKGYLVPAGRSKAETFTPRMPPSLREALLDFVLALAARYQRGFQNRPACMLVHTHYRTVVQFRMRELIEQELQTVRDAWRYSDGGVPELEARWDDFRRTITAVDVMRDVPFSALRSSIDQVFRDPMSVLLLNSGSDDALDYETSPSLQGVVIGGNRLSRGLTLEGLLVSYFLRDTHYYDTLLQMGRWFGYRGTDVDLTRLYTTRELMTMFRDLALAEEELRYEVARYEREGLTPVDFGPKIRLHPAMMVTARNKMGAGQTIQQSYSGRLLSTVSFRLDDRAWLAANLQATRKLLASLGPPTDTTNGITWTDVAPRRIEMFLDDYQTPGTSRIDPTTVRRYISEQVNHGELTRWRVSVRSLRKTDSTLGVDDLGIEGVPQVNLISRSQEREYAGSIKSLINPVSQKDPRAGDEVLGLDDEAIQRALQMTVENKDLGYADALRRARAPQEGLLLIYPISAHSRPKSEGPDRIDLFADPTLGCTVIGIALSFPESKSAAAIEYVANRAGAAG